MLKGQVLWCYDYELEFRDTTRDLGYQFSGIAPFHAHRGEIQLNEKSIDIVGDEDLKIWLDEITQLYLGFDENYRPHLAKNFGLFWEPLRIAFDASVIYVIVDYNLLFAKNKKWFKALKEKLG